MKALRYATPVALLMAATGCNDYELSRGAAHAADTTSYESSIYDCEYSYSCKTTEQLLEELRRSTERLNRHRRDTWRDHNRRHHGGSPRWGRDWDRDGRRGDWDRHGRNDREDRNDRGGRDRHDWDSDGRRGRGGFQASLSDFGLEPVSASVAKNKTAATAAVKAPLMTKEYHMLCKKIGKAYGISHTAATKLMEALNRAAVEDFVGLRELGLTPDGLKAAYNNHGRFTAGELDIVGRKLGISRQKADQVIHRMLKIGR